MKVLFAVSNENISETIIKKYQSMYKEIISGKNVYYFNAILKELQKDKSYDRIVISEDLEPFANKNYEMIDNFLFEKLDSISDEAVTNAGEDIPIILIATDRRTQGEQILNKLFGIGVYSTLIGQDRSIPEVCKLINKPRSKKEAKIYYKIDANDVDYKSENEDHVSEVEIQNILSHYKKLGKNEDKYVESFNSIASQYTDEQLKVIVKFLPIKVKAVLEANSPKYQQIAVYAGESAYLKKQKPYESTQINSKTSKPRSTNQAIIDNGIKIESIGETQTKKMTKPVVIPATVSTKNVKKIERKDSDVKVEKNMDNKEVEKNVDNNIKDLTEEVLTVKKGRGRPKKVQLVEEMGEQAVEKTEPVEVDLEVEVQEQPKKRRGRPKKVENVEEKLNNLAGNSPKIEHLEETVLPGFEEDDILPGFEQEGVVLPSFEKKDETVVPAFDIEEAVLPGFEQEDVVPISKQENAVYSQTQNNITKEKQIANYKSIKNNIDALLTADKKIVSFVGTTKNGTSFLVNNMAEMFSKQGIKTAILDLTKNKNSYYIYTENEEGLRVKAMESTEKLSNGIAQGVPVNNNLDVYTSVPGENSSIDNSEAILSTLLQNYTLILLDCDFDTNYSYLEASQEIYLVQSMDVLTIQPLTAYLRDLKAKDILDQSKLRIVINKYTRVRSVTEKTIIAGMAFYNDPSMSFMTELFNRETIRYAVVPFEVQTYAKYLEGLINCNITTNGYSKDFMNSLKKLGNMVYPLINNTTQNKYNNPKYNKYIQKR